MSAAVSLISQLDELRWRDGHLTPHPCTYAHAPTLQGAPSPPHTHALEQVTDYDGKADIWSLGITAIEMAQVHFRLAVAVCVCGRWSLGIAAIAMAQVHFHLRAYTRHLRAYTRHLPAYTRHLPAYTRHLRLKQGP